MKSFLRSLWFIFRLFLLAALVFLFARAWVLRPQVYFEPLALNESFQRVTHVTSLPNDPNQLVVTEKHGQVKIFDHTKDEEARLILDISNQVQADTTEEGLLTTVFHKNYPEVKQAFIYYNVNNPMRIRLSRLQVGENHELLAETEEVVWEVAKAGTGHNGGGPMWGEDGMLWLAVGEASYRAKGQGDLLKSNTTMFGSILRLNVDSASGDKAYSIPADNPFVGNDQGIPEEVWAMGLRNPWRYSFLDGDTLIVGDVGHDTYEEINVINAGDHLGWPTMEGPDCHYPGKGVQCDKEPFTLPRWSFTHAVSRSITGGLIYRGSEIEWLTGKYIFADYVRGLFAIDLDESGVISEMTDPRFEVLQFKLPMVQPHRKNETILITAFHEDPDGEVFLGAVSGGVYRLRPASLWYLIKGYFYVTFTFR